MVEAEIKEYLKNFALGCEVDKKYLVSTHFLHKQGVIYYGLHHAGEYRLLNLLAKAHDTNAISYMHECFSSKFALVFDIDGKNKKYDFKSILNSIFSSIQKFFAIPPVELYCIVFTATNETKFSYHIHFPDIIVNTHILNAVYNSITKQNAFMKDFIDTQIVKSQKLRLAFSDKWDRENGKPLGRKLLYYGTFDNNAMRMTTPWENDTYELLTRSSVRRADFEQLSPIKGQVHIDNISLQERIDMCKTDFIVHDQQDFETLDPSFFTVNQVPIVIEYIKNKYHNDIATLQEKVIKFMNQFIFMITDHPGKVLIVMKKINHDRDRQKFTYINKSESDFKQIFQHVVVLDKSTEGANGLKSIQDFKSIANVWLHHPNKKSYGSLVFDPRPDAFIRMHSDFNIYQGLAITLEDAERAISESGVVNYEDKCQTILKHIFEIWCAENKKVYNYVLKWLASALLRPWNKLGVALVLVGSEGCGKSMIVDAIGKIFEEYYIHLCEMMDLTGRFNSLLANGLLIFADEAFWGGNKADSGKLKGMITEKQIRCEQKGVDTYYLDNFSNYIMASNHYWAVPAGENARRWCCLGCKSTYNLDNNYFTNLKACLYDENMLGVKCLLKYLSTIDISNFVPNHIPVTQLLRQQKENSFDSLESWYDQVLHRAYIIPWNEYDNQEFNVTEFEDEGLKRFQKGPKYGYQMLPLQHVYNYYHDEMRNKMGSQRPASYQRFKQFLRDKEAFVKTKPPCKQLYKEIWLLFNFKQLRMAWKKKMNDPEMEFDDEELD
ncbi:MAG: hypothetical protein CMB64_04825 [Euryarchaeota archaeon]|nr:hypothetical protein [Euryarchaeota archaeon]